jgi:phosphoglycolate phosphatase
LAQVILFDVDNTLLYTGGAGSLAFNQTFHEMFGIPDGFARVEFSGRTDRYILEEGLACHSIDGGAARHLDEFTTLYYKNLSATLTEREGYVMPGFPELLGALEDAGARLGVATGNFSRAASMKLEYYRLSQYFAGGGFGEISIDRPDVVQSAIRAVADGVDARQIAVVGDTPHDISSGLAHGTLCIGVATGQHSKTELLESRAHVVFEDFSDWPEAARLLLSS